MTDHLPECPWPTPPCSHTPLHDRQPLFCIDCLTECVCDRLGACERRVLDAAQEAIRNREDGEYFPWVQVEIALAAIERLRWAMDRSRNDEGL